MNTTTQIDRSARLVGATIRPSWNGAELSLLPDVFTAVQDAATADEYRAAVQWDDKRGWCVRIGDADGENTVAWCRGASDLLNMLDGFVYTGAAPQPAKVVTLRFHDDGGHGWLEVPLAEFPDALTFGTGFGYYDARPGREVVFLEEDGELAAFHGVHANDYQVETVIHYGSAPCRRLPRVPDARSAE